MGYARTAISLTFSAVIASIFFGAGCGKKESDAPPPMPTATDTGTAAPPPQTAPTPVPIQTAAPLPGVAPNTLAEAIAVTKPQMADSTGAPDPGSAGLLQYWLSKNYPWAQLEQQPESPAATFLSSAATERGKRVCGQGTVQAFNKVNATPAQYEATLVTKEGQTLSIGALGDATGIAAGKPARFCGIASGVQTLTSPTGQAAQAIRDVGYFDTPANRGGGGGQFGSLKACCQALQQNAASMPPPQNMYAMSAASYCMATVASISSPAQKDATLAAIRGMLKGAPMPGVCH